MARPKSDIEPRIIHAARRRFLEDGVDGASLRKIAREAGTNIGMIYYYFPTKDDLFLAYVAGTQEPGKHLSASRVRRVGLRSLR